MELRWIDEHIGGRPYGVDVVMPASYAGAGEVNPDHLAERVRADDPARATGSSSRTSSIATTCRRCPPRPTNPCGCSAGPTRAPARRSRSPWPTPSAFWSTPSVPPPKDIVDEAHEHGVKVAALIGSVQQAERQKNQGVDIIVARGTRPAATPARCRPWCWFPRSSTRSRPFPCWRPAGSAAAGRWPPPWPSVPRACGPVPSGSPRPRAAPSPQIQEKLLAATSRDTVRSRCLSGKPARQLQDGLDAGWDEEGSPGTLPMPLQFMLTADAQKRIARSGNTELVGCPSARSWAR